MAKAYRRQTDLRNILARYICLSGLVAHRLSIITIQRATQPPFSENNPQHMDHPDVFLGLAVCGRIAALHLSRDTQRQGGEFS